MDQATYEACVSRASLAPTVHNTQPARWTRDGSAVTLFCDTNVGLRVGDPEGHDAALSCGAVLEGFVLAASAAAWRADVDVLKADATPGQGLVAMAHLTLTQGAEPDGLEKFLEDRATWRNRFIEEPAQLFGWTREDMRLILDRDGRAFIAHLNDHASLQIMQHKAFRRELVSWMRLRDDDPRAGLDGMDRASMHMSKFQSKAAPLALGPFWPVLHLFGATKGLTAEAEKTLTAPAIALFHRDKDESPILSGRAYLRLCLEAASLGFAGWPMAALSDHPATAHEICTRLGISSDRRFIQAIRFGRPTAERPARARLPLRDVLR